MSTLLLRMAAPLQSWGVDAKFDRRGTERLPTKSGVIGLAAAALGRRRNESIDDLCTLRFGIRADREGVLLRDYHTAKSKKSAYVTNRHYLADAVFLAGLQGDEALLELLEQAFRYPAFALCLGRRSCPPEGQLFLGIRRGKSLMEALLEEPWQVSGWLQQNAKASARIITDEDEGCLTGHFQRDLPLSFDQKHRKFEFRSLQDHGLCAIQSQKRGSSAPGHVTDHDPMSELEV